MTGGLDPRSTHILLGPTGEAEFRGDEGTLIDLCRSALARCVIREDADHWFTVRFEDDRGRLRQAYIVPMRDWLEAQERVRAGVAETEETTS